MLLSDVHYKYKTLPAGRLPATQILDSKTFQAPPLEGSLTLPELYDWHLVHNPDHPLFAYVDSEGKEQIIRWGKAVRSIYKIANDVRSRVGREPNVKGKPQTVVAILSAADSITYFLNFVGICRAGYAAFPISPRNSPGAVAHLLRKANVTHVLVGGDHAIQTLFSLSLDALDDSYRAKLKASAMPTFDEAVHGASEFEPAPKVKFDMDGLAFVIHSSGSTAFPKPIPWTHYRFLQVGWIPYFGERDFCGLRFSLHAMPMYHAMGVMLIGISTSTGLTLTAFEPRIPATLPSPDLVMQGAIDTKADIVFCVPSFVEIWSKNPEYVEHLKTMKGVLYGGGPLNQQVGDELVEKGVPILMLYGCSELGTMNRIVPKSSGKDWNYFQISEQMNPRFRPDGFGHFELVMVPNPYEVPSVFNTTEDGIDAYATSDLLEPHPEKPGFWRVYGRADDQIMHSTGEKTNPGPLETILNQDKQVRTAVMFGRGQFNAGVLIDPVPQRAFDPDNIDELKKFRDEIWPSVERMNEYAPQHSRVFKEMILVAHPSKPFTYTAKMTARRQAIIDDYEEEIQALYDSLSGTTESDLPIPETWSFEETLNFTREVVKNVMNQSIQDTDDFFRFGCDSLQATWIKNNLLNALQLNSEVEVGSIPVNFVYHNPSVDSLATYISGLANPSARLSESEMILKKIKEMENMVEKYSKDFYHHIPSKPMPNADAVIVTGTTGGLGSLLLAKLIESPNVDTVYALNRKGSDLRGRQERALEERGLDPAMLDSPKLLLLDADFADPTLGLDADTYETLRSSVTHIIHNAYPVNFNMALTSFEPSIAGLRHFIDLALSSPLAHPPRIVFTSSVSTVHQYSGDGEVPETDLPATCALGSGYGESKWVCDRVLALASKQTPLKAVTIRIGQMCGMSTSGYWTSREWLPSLVKSSIAIGCLPDIKKDICWIPIDTAADVVLEMRNSPKRILHLGHPAPVPWSSVFQAASERLDLPLVDYSEWMEVLEGTRGEDGDDVDIEGNPALKLLDFFQNASESNGHTSEEDNSREAFGVKKLSLKESERVSSTLRGCRASPLSGDSVNDWISSWEKAGFIEIYA